MGLAPSRLQFVLINHLYTSTQRLFRNTFNVVTNLAVPGFHEVLKMGQTYTNDELVEALTALRTEAHSHNIPVPKYRSASHLGADHLEALLRFRSQDREAYEAILRASHRG